MTHSEPLNVRVILIFETREENLKNFLVNPHFCVIEVTLKKLHARVKICFIDYKDKYNERKVGILSKVLKVLVFFTYF